MTFFKRLLVLKMAVAKKWLNETTEAFGNIRHHDTKKENMSTQ